MPFRNGHCIAEHEVHSRKAPAAGSMPKILHVFPESVVDTRYAYLGSTKDIRGRTEYFKVRHLEYDELIGPRSNLGIVSQIRQRDLKNYSAVIFEMTLSPLSLAYLRRVAPELTIVTRSHNAELFHRLDHIRSSGCTWQGIRSLGSAPGRILYDYLCAKLSDFVLAISEWERDHYWRLLSDRSKVLYAPFFLPASYESELKAAAEKKPQCVCLLSVAFNPLLVDAAQKFASVVKSLNGRCAEWAFYLTGTPAMFPVRVPERVRWTGLLASPYQLLSESKALALLSDFGYGFKTKILEATLAKTFIIISRELYKRLPVDLQPFCIPIHVDSAGSFEWALKQCHRPYPGGDLNAIMRRKAFAALDAVLGRPVAQQGKICA